MEKRILVDASSFSRREATGIGTYARSVVNDLQLAGAKVRLLFGRNVANGQTDDGDVIAAQFFGQAPAPPLWERLGSKAKIRIQSTIMAGRVRSAHKVIADGIDLRAIEPPIPAAHDIWNVSHLYDLASATFAARERFVTLEPPAGTTAAHWTHPTPISARGVPNIVTIHDLIPIQFPYFVLDKRARALKLHKSIADRADLIITVSETSKKHIVDTLNVPEEKVMVTYQSLPIRNRIDTEDAERLVSMIYGVRPRGYVLFLGAIEPKKNVKRLIEAHLMAGTGLPLLVAGPTGWLCDDDLALLKMIESRTDFSMGTGVAGPPVRRLGFIPRSHVTALLQCATFLAFPSIYEGFGLPVLEAMQLGTPVLTSSTGSIPEVAGPRAVYVNPFDVSDMARQIRRLASDSDLRAELSLHGPSRAALFDQTAHASRLRTAYSRVGITLDK